MFHVKHFFEIVVVGGGHAGVEAAHVASRMGVSIALITHSFKKLERCLATQQSVVWVKAI